MVPEGRGEDETDRKRDTVCGWWEACGAQGNQTKPPGEAVGPEAGI